MLNQDVASEWLHELHCAGLPPTGVHFWKHIGAHYGHWYVLVDGELQQRFYATEAEARQALAKAKQRAACIRLTQSAAQNGTGMLAS